MFLPWHFTVAYVLDLLLGDPSGWPHPVRWIGLWISRVEILFYKEKETPNAQRLSGCFFVSTVIAGVAGATAFVLGLTFLIHPLLGYMTAIWLAYTTLATRSLHVSCGGGFEGRGPEPCQATPVMDRESRYEPAR